MGQEYEIRRNLLLGVLVLSDVPLTADELAYNFNCDPDAVAKLIGDMAADGFVNVRETGHAEIAERGKERVKTRSPA